MVSRRDAGDLSHFLYKNKGCHRKHESFLRQPYFFESVIENYAIVRISLKPVTSKISMMVAFTFATVIEPWVFMRF